VILPENLAEEIGELAADTYITPSLLSQAVVLEFITRGSFEPHLRRSNELLRMRRDAMLAALEKHIPDAKWTRPEGGYFVWVELPGMPDSRVVLERAQGVTAVSGAEFGAPAYMVRLAYSFAAPDEIDAGVERLAAAL
jgi:DNA-binding transcriptional MocR family regulator